MTSLRTQQTRREIVREALIAMNQRLDNTELSLNDIARTICVSSRQLQRSFQGVGSKGFQSELSKLRVLAAAQLLRDNPQATITDAVERVGLRHRSNFARLFRQRFGINPAEWREQLVQSQATPAALNSLRLPVTVPQTVTIAA
jgi:AraC-like DNA-binding protein